MLKQTTYLIVELFGAALLAACSSSLDKRVDDPLAQDAGILLPFPVEGGAPGVVMGSDAGADVCPFARITCVSSNGKVEARTCDGKGGFSKIDDCASRGTICSSNLGCVTCEPGTTSCGSVSEGGVPQATVCDRNGTLLTFACDPDQGLTCAAGACVGACSPDQLGTSNTGCEFWPTVTPTIKDSGFHFSVLLANDAEVVANVVVNDTPALERRFQIQPHDRISVPFTFGKDPTAWPWDWNPNVPTEPVLEQRISAFRVRSDRPLNAFQLATLNDAAGSHSNDGSLLLPTHALRSAYTVTGYHSVGGWFPTGDFISVTAIRDNTVLFVQPRGSLLSPEGSPPQKTYALQAGESLQLINQGRTDNDSYSGTEIATQDDVPVQVISGVPCADFSSSGGRSCKHIEESVFPRESFGKDYVVTVPRAFNALAGPVNYLQSSHSVRIQATADDTGLEFDPASIHAPTVLAKGEVLDLPNVTKDFAVTSKQAFAVTQYLRGGQQEWAGSPAQSNVVPNVQFRKNYRFATPDGYNSSFVNIVAPAGAVVTLDGTVITASDFAPVSRSGMSIASKILAPGRDAHQLVSDKPLGAVLYGYGGNANYMYPAGLDLKRVAK